MNTDSSLQPFLKWAGGKRQLLAEIRSYLPCHFATYYEPFVGGGAALFGIQPARAVINDVNAELINLYAVIKASPDALITALREHKNTEAYYYALRAQDLEEGFSLLPSVQRAARMLYLNKTCYNGLFRVNAGGHFNVPFGHYKNPAIVDESVIHAASRYLNEADVALHCGDFEDAVATAGKGDVVYCDPPYDPLSVTSSFTGYSQGGFGKKEQLRLKEACDRLTQRGCSVLLSNSATDFIRDLYGDSSRYRIIEVRANRAINAVATGRGKISELLILNRPVC